MDETAMVCHALSQWLEPESSQFRCLRVPRRVTWGDIQRQVDASSGAFGREESFQQDVWIKSDEFAAELSKAARCVAAQAWRAGVPNAVCQQMQTDAEDVAMVLRRLVPTAERVALKLEFVGESSCSRWHQDQYVGRAIVTYNGLGTVYARHSNVDFWELNNCGNNACILTDRSQVFSVDTGDIFLIKGKKFPGAVNGLVHKSPAIQYHEDGSVKYRLILKVDLP